MARTDTTATSAEWAPALLLRFLYFMTMAHEELLSKSRLHPSCRQGVSSAAAWDKTFGFAHYNALTSRGCRVQKISQSPGCYRPVGNIMRDPAAWNSPSEFWPGWSLDQDSTLPLPSLHLWQTRVSLHDSPVQGRKFF